MAALEIEQALVVRSGSGPAQLRAHSDKLTSRKLEACRQLCQVFTIPAETAPAAEILFTWAIDRETMAIVRTRRLSVDQPDVYHIMLVPRQLYIQQQGDPFRLSQLLPATWETPEYLPAWAAPLEQPPRRTVTDVQALLKLEVGPMLLGAAQVLVDGARLALARPGPDDRFIRDLWMLLPLSTRLACQLATFAANTHLGFHVVVLPRLDAQTIDEPLFYVTEEQAGGYPEGRYELHLQIAVEAGDQGELDRLFARPSSAQVWKLGVFLLLLLVLMSLMGSCRGPASQPEAIRTQEVR